MREREREVIIFMFSSYIYLFMRIMRILSYTERKIHFMKEFSTFSFLVSTKTRRSLGGRGCKGLNLILNTGPPRPGVLFNLTIRTCHTLSLNFFSPSQFLHLEKKKKFDLKKKIIFTKKKEVAKHNKTRETVFLLLFTIFFFAHR